MIFPVIILAVICGASATDLLTSHCAAITPKCAADCGFLNATDCGTKKCCFRDSATQAPSCYYRNQVRPGPGCSALLTDIMSRLPKEPYYYSTAHKCQHMLVGKLHMEPGTPHLDINGPTMRSASFDGPLSKITVRPGPLCPNPTERFSFSCSVYAISLAVRKWSEVLAIFVRPAANDSYLQIIGNNCQELGRLDCMGRGDNSFVNVNDERRPIFTFNSVMVNITLQKPSSCQLRP